MSENQVLNCKDEDFPILSIPIKMKHFLDNKTKLDLKFLTTKDQSPINKKRTTTFKETQLRNNRT